MNANPVSQDEKTIAALTHAGGIFFAFVPSLVVWILKKDSSPFIADQAMEALNFQITVLIGYIVSAMLVVILIGWLFLKVVMLTNLVLCLIAAVKASTGERYRYPFTVRLIK